MLVLTRHENEAIVITTPAGDTIRLVVIKNGSLGGKVRLGIEAPTDHTIHRQEIQNRVEATKDGPLGDYSARVVGTSTILSFRNLRPVEVATRAVERHFHGKNGTFGVTVWSTQEGAAEPIYQVEVKQEALVRISGRIMPQA